MKYSEHFRGGTDILMPVGMTRYGTGGAIAVVNSAAGPLLGVNEAQTGYTSTPATGLGEAVVTGNIPLGLMTAKALKRRGVVPGKIVSMFSGAGGQSVNTFNSDPTDGVQDLRAVNLYNNREKVMAETARLATVGEILFTWNQGEADRLMARGDYAAGFRKMWAERLSRYQHHFPGVPAPRIFMFQTGGYARTQDNHWMMLDQIDLIREFDGILIGPHHGVRIYDGNVHLTNEGYIHQAELNGWARAEVKAGRSWNLMPPVSVARSGDTITIPISTRSDETLTTEPGKYAAYGGDPANLGLTADGGGSIVSASVSGANIVVQVSGTVTAIRHAHQRNDGVDYGAMTDANGEAYVAKRSIIRTTLTENVTVAGHAITLKRWLPTFEVLVQ